MSHENLSAIPEQIVSGTTVEYTRTYGEFPADDGWSLTLYLAGVGTFSKAGVASASSFVFTLSAADTGGLAPGNYRYEERASKAGEVFVAADGTIEVLDDIATASAGDLQSWEERTLPVVEAALDGRMTSDMQSYTIAGRQVTKIPVDELMRIRVQLKRTIKAQANPGKLGPQVRVEFSGVSSETWRRDS